LNEIDLIRACLWDTHDGLMEEDIDSERAEQMISALDSLTDLVRLETEAELRKEENKAEMHRKQLREKGLEK
jgi:hypothetical protein